MYGIGQEESGGPSELRFYLCHVTKRSSAIHGCDPG